MAKAFPGWQQLARAAPPEDAWLDHMQAEEMWAGSPPAVVVIWDKGEAGVGIEVWRRQTQNPHPI